jgi:iron complex transport system substrate-binding protein
VLSALPAVSEGRSIFIEGADYDALQFSSALSLPYLLESFVPQLADSVG